MSRITKSKEEELNKQEIDEAFDFYNIDSKYKDRCYKCIYTINNNECYKEAFYRVYKNLYCNDFETIRKLWEIKDINKLFINNIDQFCTNIMILLGFKIHDDNMKKMKLDDTQVEIHKKRVRECFESDLVNREYKQIRISQMLWAIYFIRGKILELGRLQYEIYDKDTIKIHIPKGFKLDFKEVMKSLETSKKIIPLVYNINDFKCVCNSWILSNQVYDLLEKESNIAKFHDLFNIENGEDCINDILNFVYGVDRCDNYDGLKEDTSLQRKIKLQLLNSSKFYLGQGILKEIL